MNDPWNNLPPGVTDADCEGPEEIGEDGLTYRERIEIEKAEHKADLEQDR